MNQKIFFAKHFLERVKIFSTKKFLFSVCSKINRVLDKIIHFFYSLPIDGNSSDSIFSLIKPQDELADEKTDDLSLCENNNSQEQPKEVHENEEISFPANDVGGKFYYTLKFKI